MARLGQGNFRKFETEDSSKDEFVDDVKTLKAKSVSAINTIDDHTWKVIEERIINNPNLKWEDTAPIGVLKSDNGNSFNQSSNSSVRNCKICFVNYDEKLDTLFKKIVNQYNYEISGWKYNIDTLETIQLTHYGPEDHYDWHLDEFPTDLVRDNKEFNRKDVERARNLIQGKTSDSTGIQVGYKKKRNLE